MRWPVLVAAVLALGLSTGCSVKRVAIGGLADALSAGGEGFATDDDPELIRAAVPFSLKTMESLLAEVPEHRGLLLSACSGFTQYAYAFVQADAELVEADDFEKAQALRARALRMYKRATAYCLRNLEVRYPGLSAGLKLDPAAALAVVTDPADVPALYWAGAAWGSAVSLGLEDMDLVADLPATRALMDRALALDEDYAQGAIHAALISMDALPETMGGSVARARQHYERAVALSQGQSAGVHVTLATAVAQPAQDRAEFEALLNKALAIDADQYPSWRLANLIAQQKARDLLARVDTLILEAAPEPPAEPPAESPAVEPPLARLGRSGLGIAPSSATWARVPGAPRQGDSAWFD
jgi:predicted anti-sigma-YlaC factor YlaD